MSIQEQIETLEGLAQLDVEIQEMQCTLEGEQSERSGKRQQLQDLEERLARNRGGAGEMDRLRGELVQEVRQMSLQIEKSREKMSRCRTEREANAVQRELEELRKLYRDREIEVEKLNTLAEQARGEYEDLTQRLGAISGELGASEGESASRLGGLQSLIAEQLRKREAIVKRLPAQLYRRYELVRKRRGSALASTADGTCSACHMAMPAHQFQVLMRGTSFDACPHCSRIIYYKPRDASEPSGESVGSEA